MISIIGAGKVGGSAAFNILGRRISDVVLIDVVQNLAQGEALDMMQAAPAIEFDGKIEGTSSYSEMRGSELVILTAGLARQPGMSRLDLINKNAAIVKSIAKEVVRYAPDCKLMVVTNPVDVMTYVAYKESGFERNRVFGMGNILDTLRFRSYIAMELGVSREDIRALVIGEQRFHGPTRELCLSFGDTDNRLAQAGTDTEDSKLNQNFRLRRNKAQRKHSLRPSSSNCSHG
jgi:malate dehydrogenase